MTTVQKYINGSYHTWVNDANGLPTKCQYDILQGNMNSKNCKDLESYQSLRIDSNYYPLSKLNPDINKDQTFDFTRWSYLKMSQNTFNAMSWMNNIIMILLETLFVLWFVIMPPWLLYFLTDPKSKPLFGELLREDVRKDRIPLLLFVFLIIGCSFFVRFVILNLW